MIIVLVKYECKPGCRDKFYQAIKEQKINTKSQAESGNFRYDYAYDAEDENVLVLTELWESRETIDAHSQTEHFKSLGNLKALYVNDTKIHKFEGNRM